eukprot:CAMPEP_0116051052 /NCGR_PEP_ID=MMETSP0322-20121206/746_1 /TAXON_ID=163516 /ORGANISM="Leptocylindrus danicus var. apora, Strain B651" /LENGTH=387 /DNA_ID=CAMNT_0003533719 /DNA_START=80 /DNA_END=1243 /DNA_ORIENTATION=+
MSSIFAIAISALPSRSSASFAASGTTKNIFSDFAKSLSSLVQPPLQRDVYTVAITGSSGLVGTALMDEIKQKGSVCGKKCKIIKLVRGTDSNNDDTAEDKLYWDPTAPVALDPKYLQEVDSVIHLAGENVATSEGILASVGIRPWTDSKKREIIDSRITGTKALAAAVKAANIEGGIGRPKTDFLCASGPGIYGFDGIGSDAKDFDESADTSATTGFLADLSRNWEKAAGSVSGSGVNSRVALMRFGVVLSKKGGALAKLLPIFFVGGGGNVGSGEQFFPFISARDLARSILYTVETPSLNGPINMVAPTQATNADFTDALGKVLKRPTILPLPEFAVSLLFGQMGEEMLLGGQKVTPKKLLESGFEFRHSTITEALDSAINEEMDI